MSIQLDSRLAAAADMVRDGAVVADIGADHGYLVCSLVVSGKCPSGYACAVAEGPLSRAEETISAYGLSGKVEAVLSNGLRGIEGKGAGDIVICGMGGELIAGIIDDAPWVKDTRYSLVLGPMTKAERLRVYLYRSGFAIEKETAAIAGRFVYTVMKSVYTGECIEISPLLAWTGKIWDNGDELSVRYLEKVRGQLVKMSGGKDTSGLMELISEISERITPCTK